VGFRLVVGAVVAVHYAFLAFVVLGGFAALRWRWLIWPHVVAVGWALAIVTVPTLPCPLTTAEAWARRHAGMRPLAGGFIDQYVKGVLYPARFTVAIQVGVAALVLVSWWLTYRRSFRTTPRASGTGPV